MSDDTASVQNQFHVLIVDDDPMLCSLLEAKLGFLGKTPVVAGTFSSALHELTKRAYDLVLLDLRLPDSGTEETLASIRRLKLAGAKRVVIVTGADVTSGMRLLAKECGADDITSKDSREFEACLRREFNDPEPPVPPIGLRT